jgi:hypothetical protein
VHFKFMDKLGQAALARRCQASPRRKPTIASARYREI